MSLVPASEQRVAVVTALAANVGIAVAKFGASAITGSSTLLAESLHSPADSVNEILLLVGARRSRRPPDPRHPFGHGARAHHPASSAVTAAWARGCAIGRIGVPLRKLRKGPGHSRADHGAGDRGLRDLARAGPVWIARPC